MIQPTAETRDFFNRIVFKYYDKAAPKSQSKVTLRKAFVGAVLELETLSDMERFLAGHLHWLQEKKPRTIEQALDAARGNISYCYDEQMPPERAALWAGLLGEGKGAKTRSASEAFGL